MPAIPARPLRFALLLAACAPALALAQGRSPDLPIHGSRITSQWAPITRLAAKSSLRGALGMPVIAATFADVTPRFAPAVYDSAFFGEHAGVGPYSVARYYREVSLGALTFRGTTTPWLRLARTRTAYVDEGSPDVWHRYGVYARDALRLADATVDWRQYDNDGPDGIPDSGDDDGAVDLAVLLQPGSEYGCGPDSLRGFRETGYRLSLLPGWDGKPFTTSSLGANGAPIVIDDFIGASAVACNGTEIIPTRVNIPVHEIGHVLGLPDLYDYDGSSFGVGGWDIMGIFAAPPARPPHFGAWARERLGWAGVRRITSSGRIALDAAANAGDIVRIDLAGSREYLLLEHRAGAGSDASAPGTGLVVWHIDDDVIDRTFWGINDNETRPGVRVLQADGRNDLATRANVGDAGDPFPGASHTAALTATSLPPLLRHDGTPAGVRIEQIVATASRVTFDVVFERLPLTITEELDVSVQLGDTSMSHRLTASGGVAPYRWRAIDPLPQGLRLTDGGTIEGAPEALANAVLRIEVRDAESTVTTASVNLRVTMPSLTVTQALRGATQPATLDTARQRALDLLGNRNGRVDIGDVVRFREWLRTSSVSVVSSQ